MKKSTIILELIIIILLLSSMFIFREIPVLSPWKNWKVLSVPVNIPEERVLNELSKISINNVISENSSRIEVNSKLSPILPSEYNFYKNNLYRFFYDKNNDFRLYYFPKEVSNSKLKKIPFEYNIDLQSSFPYFSIIITVISYILFLFILKNKTLFAISLLPSILFSLCLPSYNSLIINLFYFVVIYFLDKYHNRKNIFQALFKNIFVVLSMAVCIIICFFSGFRGICFFAITIFTSYRLYIIFSHIIANKINHNSSFDYINIVSASKLNIHNKITVYLLYSITFFIILGALLYFLIPSISNKTINNTPLSIPTPLEYNGTRGFTLKSYSNLQTKKSPTELPDLGDFVSQVWNATVFPYTVLQNNTGYIDNVIPGTSVNTTEYFEKDGKIETKSIELATFTKQFIDTTLECIQTFNGPIIEKVLMDQKSFCAADFGNVKRTTPFTFVVFILAILFCGLQILFFFKFYKIGR